MRTKTLVSAAVVIFSLAVLLAACGGGGGGGGGTPPGDNPPGSSTPGQPLFSGFDFTLKQGDFWRYAWDYRYVYQSSGTNTDVRVTGVFQVALGAPTTINGITAYAVKITGDTQVNDGGAITILAPTKWKYLAVDNYRILGSQDGFTLTVLFDAMKGLWPGSGYFTNFGPSILYTAQETTLNNSYINIPAVVVGKSSSTSQCEYFPGYGTICGTDPTTDRNENEYYAGGLGPVGYYYRLGIDFGGTYPAWSETKTNIGLYGSSFGGQSAEAEPNDSSASAQSLVIATILACDASEDDPGTKHAEVAADTYNSKQIVADWYKIIIPSGAALKTTEIRMDLVRDLSINPSDLDLYLFDSNLKKMAESVKDNINCTAPECAALKDPTELIQKQLMPGTYYIGVHAYKTSWRTAYKLGVKIL